ncbi:hypothetical protein [Streptomyces sp. NPDC007205]|uniref:hypothetical protein n=1 Tax=Streptomyces sp. NPDC007205 TaxID=3154316 RepID=UPI0033F3FF0B
MPGSLWIGRRGDIRTVSADVARVLGEELGLARPPTAGALPADSAGVPAGSLLPPRERFSGMPARTHGFVYVDTPVPRRFELRVSVLGGRWSMRRGLGLGPLLYAVPLNAPLTGRVALGSPGGSGPAPFDGEPGSVGRLNADADLVSRANAVAPTMVGPDRLHTWQVDRLLAVEPLAPGALLVVRTFHRSTPGGWTLRADAVLDVADRIEAALR